MSWLHLGILQVPICKMDPRSGIISLGAPSTGEFPQYWGNSIFQSWGNSPVLGKQCFFFPYFHTEDGKIESYNYFFKCRISNTLWKYFIFWDYQRYFWIIAEKSKIYIHFSPVLGKFLTFGEILLKQNLPQYWGNIWPVEDHFHLVSAPVALAGYFVRI